MDFVNNISLLINYIFLKPVKKSMIQGSIWFYNVKIQMNFNWNMEPSPPKKNEHYCPDILFDSKNKTFFFKRKNISHDFQSIQKWWKTFSKFFFIIENLIGQKNLLNLSIDRLIDCRRLSSIVDCRLSVYVISR